jgi:hypothetical protein
MYFVLEKTLQCLRRKIPKTILQNLYLEMGRANAIYNLNFGSGGCTVGTRRTRLKIASVLTRVNKSVSSLGQD